MNILQIIHTMIQNITLPLDPPGLFPSNPYGQHLPTTERVQFCASDIGDLFQFELFGFVEGGASVSAEGEHA